MTIDQLPIRWNFIFELAIILGIIATAAQVKLADMLDERRFNSSSMSLLFQLRRGSRWLKILVLCWMAVYAYNRGWNAWPPVVAFVAAFDFWVILDVLVMRKDLKRLQRRESVTGQRARN